MALALHYDEGSVRDQDNHSPAVNAASGEDWSTLVKFELPSDPGIEREAMEKVADAVRSLGIPTTSMERLKTAVAEATMNAIEHGNKFRSDLTVLIELFSTPERLKVRITDHGGGQPIPNAIHPDLDAKLAGRQSPRGWGLFLIKNMVDDMKVYSDDTHHVVELFFNLKGDRNVGQAVGSGRAE